MDGDDVVFIAMSSSHECPWPWPMSRSHFMRLYLRSRSMLANVASWFLTVRRYLHLGKPFRKTTSSGIETKGGVIATRFHADTVGCSCRKGGRLE